MKLAKQMRQIANNRPSSFDIILEKIKEEAEQHCCECNIGYISDDDIKRLEEEGFTVKYGQVHSSDFLCSYTIYW